MDSDHGSVTAELERKRKRKRQERFTLSPSQSTVVPSTPPSTSRPVTSTPTPSTTLGRNVVSPQTSNQPEVTMASTPIDISNKRGIRSKESLNLLEGDHVTVKAGLQKRWVLPRKLLLSHSPYFARILSEGRAFSLQFGEEEAFEIFVQWLYLGELDFDGVDVSSGILVRAWVLGDTYGCPAFKDHVMVQLIKLHRERGIDPLRFRLIFDSANSGSKLRKWAIDQFHAKITYGYAGYDSHMDEDRPNDKKIWKKNATELEQFSQDFLGACLDAGQGVNRMKKPWENGQQYMEVLSYAEIGVCKEEGRSGKAEATLTKAERR